MRLQRLTETVGDIITETDLDGRLTYVSDAISKITGYRADEVLGRVALDSVHPDDRERTQYELQKAVAAADHRKMMFRLVRKDGRPIWLETSPMPLVDQTSGQVCGVSDVMRDATIAKTELDAIARLEAQYRFIFDKAQSGLVLHGRESEILFAIARASELLGGSAEDIAGLQTNDPRWRFLRSDGSPMPVDEFPASRAAAARQPVRGLILGIRQPRTEDVVWVTCDAHPFSIPGWRD